MTGLSTFSLALNGALLALLACLWFSTKLITGRAKTVPEATARMLYRLGRLIIAWAEALDSAIICYRDMTSEGLVSRSEVDRELRKVAGRRKVAMWEPRSEEIES